MLSAGETLDEDESDSGSQVIALEDSESFDQDAATMLKADEGGLGVDAFQPVGMESGIGGAATATAGGQPMYVQVASAETPYWACWASLIRTTCHSSTGCYYWRVGPSP